jgi:hypothetical protein
VEPVDEGAWDALVHAFVVWQTAIVEVPVALDSVTLEVVGPAAGAFHLVSLGLDPS